MAQWTNITTITPARLLRQFRLSEPDGASHADLQGVNALTGTAVQTFHNELLQIGLPFRINVRGVADVSSNVEDGSDTIGFALPPISVNPLQAHGMNTWADFTHLVTQQLTTYGEEMLERESEVNMTSIKKLEITYVPQGNLAAFQPHLQAMGGGAARDLPPDLVAKKCVLNIMNEDDQCLRCASSPGNGKFTWSLTMLSDGANTSPTCQRTVKNLRDGSHSTSTAA